MIWWEITADSSPIRFPEPIVHFSHVHHLFCLTFSTMFTYSKLATDILISLFATFILTTTIISISTNHWNISTIDSLTNRTGLFQRCSSDSCCEGSELDRSITLLSLATVVLLSIGTLASFLLMPHHYDHESRSYILVPLTLFLAGIMMTLTLIQIFSRLQPNGSSAYMFMIDNILAYILGGIALVHASVFYL